MRTPFLGFAPSLHLGFTPSCNNLFTMRDCMEKMNLNEKAFKQYVTLYERLYGENKSK